jgi:hypothetical protein
MEKKLKDSLISAAENARASHVKRIDQIDKLLNILLLNDEKKNPEVQQLFTKFYWELINDA